MTVHKKSFKEFRGLYLDVFNNTKSLNRFQVRQGRKCASHHAPLLSVALVTGFIFMRLLFSSFYRTSGRAIHDKCEEYTIQPLRSFDVLAGTQKNDTEKYAGIQDHRKGISWDFLPSESEIYPISHDSSVAAETFHPSLEGDAKSVVSLASRLRFHGFQYFSNGPFFLGRHRPIEVYCMYRRFDRFHGLQYVIHFRQKHQARNSSVSLALHVQQTLGINGCILSAVRFNSIEEKKPNPGTEYFETVYIIVPFTKRAVQLKSFLQRFLILHNRKDLHLVLIISVLRMSEDVELVNGVKRDVFGSRFPHVAKSVWLCENDGDSYGNFSRSVAIREAARIVPYKGVAFKDPVLFICDVDLILKPTFFFRCRINAIPGSQVFFPIFYNLYLRSHDGKEQVSANNGYWRTSSLGMLCIRRSDFIGIGAYRDAESRFHGWGLEDVYLHEFIVNKTSLVVFRAVEPGLLHRWHPKECSATSEDYDSCVSSKLASLDDPKFMTTSIYRLLPELGMRLLLNQMERSNRNNSQVT